MTGGSVLLRLAAALLLLGAVAGARGDSGNSSQGELSFSRSGCGQSKVCVETPASCEPSSSGPCLFTSAQVQLQNLSFSLRGDSPGYVALGLSSSVSQGWSFFFVCGNKNNSFFFETAERNMNLENATLHMSNLTVAGVKGEVDGNVTRCIFSVQSSDLKSTRSSNTVFTLTLGTGSVNGSELGLLKEDFRVGLLDLSDPKATPGPPAVSPTTRPTGSTAPVPGRGVRPGAPLSALTLPVLLALTVLK